MAVRKIGRYVIVRELDQGGMATVFLCHDPTFERQVAVKVLPPELTRDPKFRVRFAREAKLIAALEHPCIVPVYEYSEEGDEPFIAMRYMAGGTLSERIAGQPMPLEEIAPIIQRVASALDEAHHQNIVHRDLKPSNVMFDTRGDAYLTDFGLAKVMESTSLTLTGTAFLIGTPAYMSPEQAVGDQVIDWRSDVYGLGVILYEMLTGQQPYKADTAGRLMLKHVVEPVPTLDAEALGLPAEWNDLLAFALAKRPQDRYQTAGELSEAVSALSAASGGGAGARRSIASTPRPAPREPGAGDRPAQDESPTIPLPSPSRPFPAPRSMWRLSARMFALIGVLLIVALAGWTALLTAGGQESPTATPTSAPTNTVPATATPSATTGGSATEAPVTQTSVIAIPTLATATPSRTPSPTPTETPSATPTRRPVVATPSPTATPVVPSPTAPPPPPPPAPPTRTPTVTPTATPTTTPTETSTITPNPTNSPGPTKTTPAPTS
jgi:serine/threonine-protein kinase